MKRYLIFAGTCFYARGGFNDLAGAADTVDEAKVQIAAIEQEDHGSDSVDWWQIVDAVEGSIVAKSDAIPLGADVQNAAPYHMQFFGGYLVPQAVELGDDDDD